ncbi:MAG TPA: cysteine peptidase family C39 domain-containing protein, partial [Pirellulaceae bacterium]
MLRRRRVPVVLQMNSVECGAACLAMMLGYYGRPTSLADCREECAPGRDGVTAQTMVAAARKQGLRVKAYSVQSDANLRDVPLPAIVHWNFSHYLVLERISSVGVEVVDPADGRRHLTPDEFAQGFTGVILTMEPGPGFEPRPSTSQPLWQQFLRVMWQTPGTPAALLQILIASLVLQILGLGIPLFTQILVDSVLPYRIRSVLVMLGLGMMILVLAQMVS